MHCQNCGHRLDASDKFCTKCGTAVHSEIKEQTHTSAASEGKWWYRLLKVAYILSYVFSIGLVLIISYSAMPQRTLDGNLSLIKCNNGTNYAPEKNSIYLYGDSLSSYQDENARILCAYDTTNYYRYTAPSYKNYTFAPYYIEPDYSSWFFYSLLALLITWSVLKLIRLGVQYIAFGHSPRWVKEFKKLY